jgi:hypothetical protein
MTWHQHGGGLRPPVPMERLIEVWPIGDTEPHVVEVCAADWSRPLRWRFVPLESIGTVTASSAIKLVYVAGRYRGKTPSNVALNIAAAQHVGLLVAQSGAMPVIPHKNTEGFEHLDPSIHDEFWLEGTLAIMRKCDAVVLVPGWEQSSGTRGEVAESQRLGIPVYLSVSDMVAGRAL